MRRLTIMLAILMLTQAGCMGSGPIAGCFQPTVDYASVKVGMTKEQLDTAIAEVGAPIDDANRTFIYRYEHTDAWEWRKWVYTWTDALTLYTAEVIFAPAEYLLVYRPAQRSAIATFDERGQLVAFRQFYDRAKYRVGGTETPAHTNPGPYSQAWEWSTFWGRGRTDCKRGHES